MKKVLCVLIVMVVFSGAAFGASSSELKRMSTFLSNFTELGMMNFYADDLSDGELARFGIWHNYVNNYKTRVKYCPNENCPYGSLVIDKTYVAESVRKFFNREIRHQSAPDESLYGHYDGKKYYHFEGADGEAAFYAKVYEAEKRGNVIIMRGETYEPEHGSEGSTFTARAKPYKYGGKNTWSILSLEVDD